MWTIIGLIIIGIGNIAGLIFSETYRKIITSVIIWLVFIGGIVLTISSIIVNSPLLFLGIVLTIGSYVGLQNSL